MKVTEKSYALKRVADIADEKIRALRGEEEEKSIEARRASMLRDGSAKFKSSTRLVSKYDNIVDYFVFPGVAEKIAEQRSKHQAKITKIKKRMGEVQDEIMLGDEQTALEAIRSFIAERL